MDTFHVVTKIPVPGEAITRNPTFTTFKGAKIRFLPVSVHGMGLAFMSKETSSRRETGILTGMDLATIRLKVRVDEFTGVVS
jgi:hypothetical protein